MKIDQELKLDIEKLTKELEKKHRFDRKSKAEQLRYLKNSPVYPTPFIFAKFTLNVYYNRQHDAYLPDGWHVLTTASNSKNGYFGVAYWNTKSQQVVVAHRGTESRLNRDFVKDFWADARGIWSNKFISQMNSACTFANRIHKAFGFEFQLFFTGHSLGGWLAQITTFSVKFLKVSESKFIMNDNYAQEGTHAHTVVFESPGCKDMLLKMERTFGARVGDRSMIDHLDITTYMSGPNRINTLNAHVGTIFRVFVHETQAHRVPSGLLKRPMAYLTKRIKEYLLGSYTETTHDITIMIKVFDPITGQPCKLREVEDWPESHVFGGRENKAIFKQATRDNLFQAEEANNCGELDPAYLSIRYRTNPINHCKCSLRVFTQSEQVFLKRYETLRELEDLFKTKDLFNSMDDYEAQTYSKNLLDGFVLNDAEIECESAEKLQKLIPFVKRLLRVFDNLGQEIERLSSKCGIYEKFYQHESDQYLCERESLEFESTDDSDLDLFLTIEAKQVWQLVAEQDTRLSTTRLAKMVKTVAGKSEYNASTYVLELKRLVQLDKVFSAKSFLMFQELEHLLLIVECKWSLKLDTDNEETRLLKNLFEVLQTKTRVKLVFVTPKGANLPLSARYTSSRDASFTWNSLTRDSKRKLLEKEVTFQGNALKFKELIGSIVSANELNELVDSETIVRLYNNENICVGNNLASWENDPGWYIPRRLNFTKINKDILSAEDIASSAERFLVVNNDRATRDLISTSKNHERFRIAVNFQPISEKNGNIHWLKFDWSSESFILQQSEGSLSFLREHIDDKSPAKAFSETSLLKQTKKFKVVIIADVAGMGKSTLLSSLFHKIKNDPSNRHIWLIRIKLDDFSDQLKQLQRNGSNGLNEETVVEFLSSCLEIPRSSFERNLLKLSIKTGRSIIAFDGLDELKPDYQETVVDLLCFLKKSNQKQLWVTTRPNMVNDLELKLNQFAITLQPFSPEEQIQFLNKFWEQQKMNDTSSFAKTLIDLLGGKQFTAIPLQIRILAEAFEDDFMQIQNLAPTEPEMPTNVKLLYLYERFIRKRFKLYQREQEKNSTPPSKESETPSFKEFLAQHQSLALYELFENKEREILLKEKICQEFYQEFPQLSRHVFNQPNLEKEMLRDKQKSLEQLKSSIQRNGIIEQIIDGRPHFVHRTFAEYFVAKFLVNCLHSATRVKYPQVLIFVLTVILKKEDYLGVRAFIDGQLSEKPLEECSRKLLADLMTSSLQLSHLQKILFLAIREENQAIIQEFFIKSLAEFTTLLEGVLQTEYSEDHTVLLFAAETGKWEIAKWLLENGADLNAKDSHGRRALHFAARDGRLDMIEWLINKGVDLNAKDQNGQTAAQLASEKGHLNIVNRFKENQYDALNLASRGLKSELFKRLIEKDAEVNAYRSREFVRIRANSFDFGELV